MTTKIHCKNCKRPLFQVDGNWRSEDWLSFCGIGDAKHEPEAQPKIRRKRPDELAWGETGGWTSEPDVFPHAPPEVRRALGAIMTWRDPPMDTEDDFTPCPRCGVWHIADGLPVPMCPCGYCAHTARTGDKCDFCGEVRMVIESTPSGATPALVKDFKKTMRAKMVRK